MSITAGEGTASVSVTEGVVTYSAVDGFVGFDLLTYTISDGKGGLSDGRLVVFVDGNHGPVAQKDSISTGVDMEVTLDVLANDLDLDADSLRVVSVSEGNQGMAQSWGAVSYTPNVGVSGLDEVRYVLSDGRGGVGTGTVTILVLSEALTK